MQDEMTNRHHTHEQQNCFVGSSYKAPWHDDIISACEETLPKFGLQPWYADDQFEPTKSLRDKVVEMVANARYGLYDLSWWRSGERSAWKMPQNVLIELGMAIALNRPVLMLRHVENCVAGLQLPTCLDSQQVVEFSGEYTLKRALEERLPQWLDVPPERAWWTRYCLFGQCVCTYRESYPQVEQHGQEMIRCHISDGQDTDRDDFRYMLESELGRYSDISYNYLDSLAPAAGYNFLLCTHCQMVRSTPFAIYRITPQTTAETFVAIGMSIALEKQFKCEIPKFVFTTDAHSIPSLLSGYEVVETKTTKERERRLRRFLPVVMRKVRENVWKPEPLPFVEFLTHPTDEAPVSEKERTLFSETDEEKTFFDDEESAGNDIESSISEKDQDLFSNSDEEVIPFNVKESMDGGIKSNHRRIVFSEKFSRSLERLSEPMQRLVAEKIDYLKQNPAHPSLNVHRVLRVRNRKMWVCYIGDSLRLLYQPQADAIYLWDIGAHVVVDRVHKRRFEQGSSDIAHTPEERTEAEENARCERVISQLTPRRLEILRAFAEGLHPAEVAEKLSISMPTMSTHTTVLLSLCRDVWPMREKERLDYRFLQLKFEKYFEGPGQLEDE